MILLVFHELREEGVWLYFGKKDVDLLVENFSQNYIDAVINKGKEDSWRFTGFYGFPETQNHGESWNKLRWL